MNRWRRWLTHWLYPSVGARGERIAASHLRSHGYRILARNWRCTIGEIDLIVETPDRQTLVIVEVKTSTGSDDRLRPEVHVNSHKQRQVSRLASYLTQRPPYRHRPVRFDVVGVELPATGQPIVRHHPGAFEASW